MRAGAIVCFVIAVLAMIAATQNVVGGANRPESAEDLVGYAVGSFLLPIVLLIVGLIFWGKANKGN